MVKVTKVAAWKIGDKFIESAKEAEAATRQLVIGELLADLHEDDEPFASAEKLADWVSRNWDNILVRTKEALAGT